MRQLHEIAKEIKQDWRKPYFGAVPYLDALSRMKSVDDGYGHDDGHTMVIYFLSNATGWRGDVARRIKLELKSMI